MSDSAAGSMLGHMVYFTLKEKTPEAVERHVAACRKYLSGHPGTVFFAVGPRTPDLLRDVNDKDFDVALQMVFQTREDQDRYQVSEQHVQFIEENKEYWERVRVFDADVQ